MEGFKQFIKEQGVVGLAVGFVFGAAIAKLVSAFVSDIVDPVLGVVLGATRGLDKAYFQLGSAHVNWGHFASSIIDFIILAFIVYFTVRALKIEHLIKKKDK